MDQLRIDHIENSDYELIDEEEFEQESVKNKTGKKSKTKDKDMEELFDELEQNLTTFYKKQRDEIRTLKREYQKRMKKINKKKNPADAKTGINELKKIPDDLADFIGVTKGTKMARTKLGGRVYRECKERGLVYPGDNRVMRVDTELEKIFCTTKEVNKSTNVKDREMDKALNFFNLQNYIKRCYDNEKK